jgi:hypothetical protein
MLLQRYDVMEKEDIKPSEDGEYVKFSDVMKLLKDGELIMGDDSLMADHEK